MKENKFLKLIKTLDKKEVKAFQKYLVGLYGKQEKMILLFTYFYKDLKQDKQVRLPTEIYLQTKLFKRKQSTKVISNLYADLYKYLEEFLRWQKINTEADNYVKDRLQIEIYKERNLDKWFYDRIEKTKEKINNAPLDLWHYFKLFELNYTTYFKTSTEKHHSNTMTTLEKGVYFLDNFIISAKLTYECELKNKQQLQGFSPSNNWLLDDMLKTYPNKFDDNIYALTYLNALDLLKHGRTSDYHKLKATFEDKRSFLSAIDQLIILSLLLNFIAKKMRSDDLIKYSKDALALYKIGLKEHIIINNGELASIPFFNILNVACRLNEIEWAETFCKNYAHHLNTKEQSEAIKIANGILFFEKRKFENVLLELRDVSFKNIFYGTRARALILKSAVELNMGKFFIKAECDKFDQYLRRSEFLAENSLTAFKNFVQIVRLMFVNTKTKKNQLKTFINKQELWVYKNWIDKMVDNFKGPF